MTTQSETVGGIAGPGWLPRVATAALWAMLALGIFLQFYRLGAQNLWLDEIWIAVTSDPAMPLGTWMRDWVLADVHPPLYMFLVRLWRLVFGGDELALRLFSAVAAAGTVASVLLLHRWEPVVRSPVALAALFACSLAIVRYAQEARSYALLLLLTTVATLLAVAIAQRTDRRQPIRAPVLVLGAITVVAGYVHYFGFLMGGGLFGALTLAAALRHRRHLILVVSTGLGAAALLLPWVVFHATMLESKLGGGFWIHNRWVAFRIAAELAAGGTTLFLLVAGAVAGVLALRPSLLRQPVVWLPPVAIALTLAAALLVSQHTPIVTGRNLMVLIPPFYVLTIAAFGGLAAAGPAPARLLGVAAPLVLVAVSLGVSADRIAGSQRQQWRETAELVSTLPGCRDSVIQVSFWPPEIYAYYLPQAERFTLRTVWLGEASGRPPPARAQGSCPLIVWGGRITDQEAVRLGERLGYGPDEIALWRARGHTLVLDRPRLEASGAEIPGLTAP